MGRRENTLYVVILGKKFKNNECIGKENSKIFGSWVLWRVKPNGNQEFAITFTQIN
jgi:hypothetical protein